MDKIRCEKILRDGLSKLNDEELITAVVKSVISTYADKQCDNDWQELRYLKKRVDEIWKTIKSLSEKCLVRERSNELKRVLNQIRPSNRNSVSMTKSRKMK